MNKQELIDKAIKQFGGKYPAGLPENVFLSYRDDWKERNNKYYPFYVWPTESEYDICTKDEFEQRARELGYCNGYKWGEEYETNGKKPDLPDDVEIEASFLDSENWHSSVVSELIWARFKKFRIVDRRYKPVSEIPEKQQNVSDLPDNKQNAGNVSTDSSWHDLGELPPVGWKGEYRPLWHACEVVAYHNGFAVVWDAHDLEYFRTNNPEIFRQIRTEREKFHDSALELYDDNTQVWLDAMFDAGFRAPEEAK